MHILVTGSSGFLGKFLCDRLTAMGHQVICVHSKNCDLRQKDSLNAWNKIRFDQIFHLATWTQAGDFCLYHSGEQWLFNQQINSNVLAWWQSNQKQAKMICIGTSCAYDPALPLEESYYLQGSPIESLYAYGMTKRMLLVGLMSLHRQFGLDYLYLIPSTLYGPLYHTDDRQMHFIFDLIRKILRGQFYGEDVKLWGDGEQKRELVHVNDFIDVMIPLAAHQKNTVLNIGAGREYSIRQFAEMICGYVGYSKDRIIYDIDRYVGARSKILSNAKLESIMPEYRPTSLQKGLNETIDWFIQNREQLLPQKGML